LAADRCSAFCENTLPEKGGREEMLAGKNAPFTIIVRRRTKVISDDKQEKEGL